MVHTRTPGHGRDLDSTTGRGSGSLGAPASAGSEWLFCPMYKARPWGEWAQPEQIRRAVMLDPQSHSSAQQRHPQRGRGRAVWRRAHVGPLPEPSPRGTCPRGQAPARPCRLLLEPHRRRLRMPPGPRHQVALPTKPRVLTCCKALGRHQGTHTLLATLPPVQGATSRRTEV